MRLKDAIYGIHRPDARRKLANPENGLSYFMVEGDSVLIRVEEV